MSGRVLVCGGRTFSRWRLVESTLDELRATRGVECVIHGGASGADGLAGRWARQRGVPCVVVPADWRRYGRAAGPMRNAEMLRVHAPDLVVAFPGGAGTMDMVRRARAVGVEVLEVAPAATPAPRPA